MDPPENLPSKNRDKQVQKLEPDEEEDSSDPEAQVVRTLSFSSWISVLPIKKRMRLHRPADASTSISGVSHTHTLARRQQEFSFFPNDETSRNPFMATDLQAFGSPPAPDDFSSRNPRNDSVHSAAGGCGEPPYGLDLNLPLATPDDHGLDLNLPPATPDDHGLDLNLPLVTPDDHDLDQPMPNPESDNQVHPQAQIHLPRRWNSGRRRTGNRRRRNLNQPLATPDDHDFDQPMPTPEANNQFHPQAQLHLPLSWNSGRRRTGNRRRREI